MLVLHRPIEPTAISGHNAVQQINTGLSSISKFVSCRRFGQALQAQVKCGGDEEQRFLRNNPTQHPIYPARAGRLQRR